MGEILFTALWCMKEANNYSTTYSGVEKVGLLAHLIVRIKITSMEK